MPRPVTRDLDLLISRYGGYVFAAIVLVASWMSHFAVLSNDCFPLRWQAEHLSLHNPQSFYNGFFPLGYPVLLRIVAFTGDAILTMMIIQIALSALYVSIAYRLFRIYLDECTAPLALLALLFSTQMLRAIPSATPDFFAALCVLAACGQFAKGNKRFALIGAFVGLGYLFRTHVIVLAVSFIIAIALFEPDRKLIASFLFLLGVLPFVLLQGLVQVWAGHGFFESAQAFNVWRTMYGMDWNNPPQLGSTSAFSLIARDPVTFITCVGIGIYRSAADLIPLLFVVIYGSITRRIARSLTALAFAMALYVIINTSGGSPRSLIISLPIVVIGWGYIAQLLVSRFFSTRGNSLFRMSFWVLLLVVTFGVSYFATNSGARIEEYRSVERALQVRTPADCASIYTDDFDLYFPGLHYLTPRTSGGWAGVGLPQYAKQFPPIRDSSAALEHSDLVHNGITTVVLRIPPYDPRGYQNVTQDTSLFAFQSRTRNHAIYRVR